MLPCVILRKYDTKYATKYDTTYDNIYDPTDCKYDTRY